MASVKFVGVSCSLSGILDYITNREKTTDRLITGVNCVAQSAIHEFETVKKQFHKTDGRSYYHIVQAFAPDDPLDFETAHEIGLKFAELLLFGQHPKKFILINNCISRIIWVMATSIVNEQNLYVFPVCKRFLKRSVMMLFADGFIIL